MRPPALSAGIAQGLNALGDPTRRAVFERLARAGLKPVGELARGLPVPAEAPHSHARRARASGPRALRRPVARGVGHRRLARRLGGAARALRRRAAADVARAS